MKPAPAVPEEARKYFIEGGALIKGAKEQKGYELAIDAYKQALLIAPWWQDAYYNYSVALELAGSFDDAISNLKLYLATNPPEAESRAAQDKIYEIEAKKKLAVTEKTEAARKEAEAKAREPNLDGRWAIDLGGSGVLIKDHLVIGYNAIGQLVVTKPEGAYNVKVQGNRLMFHQDWGATQTMAWDFTLSEDGMTLQGRRDSLPQTSAQISAMKREGIISIEPTHDFIILRRQ
jgi:tetratricopeptide (TPR) repeat protein